MREQLDDLNFDPANDEWVGVGPAWDRLSSAGGSAFGSSASSRNAVAEQRAPDLSAEEFRAVFELLDSGGLSVTYERCLSDLHQAGLLHLRLEHVAFVAELTEIRSSRREWIGVRAPIRRLGESLRDKRARRRRKRR